MSDYGLFWGNNLYNCKQDIEPIIDQVLYTEDYLCITSEEGIGKSVLVQQMMFNLTMGKPFLDIFEVPKPRNVLLIQTEGSRAKTITRINNMKKEIDIDDKRWVHYNVSGLSFDIKEDADTIRRTIAQTGIDYNVIIIDSLYTAVDGDLNNNKTAKDFSKNVRSILDSYGASLIVTHHLPKDSYTASGKKIEKGKKNMYGSRFWNSFFTLNYQLSTNNGIYYLDIGKNRDGNAIDKIEMVMIVPQIDHRGRLFFTTDSSIIGSVSAKITDILKHNGNLTHSDIVSKAGISTSRFYEAVKPMVYDGRVIKSKDGNGRILYKWGGIK